MVSRQEADPGGAFHEDRAPDGHEVRGKKRTFPRTAGFYALTVLLLLALNGCGTVSYFSQAITGHYRLMHSRVPIDSVLQRDDLTPEERNQLMLVSEVRTYASEKIGLPRNGSYTVFTEIKEEYPGWNVFAAPRFSVEPVKWCFPVAGCVVYRGFFSKKKALRFRRKTEEKGYDVFMGPFNAYSTLGWFDDPVLSSQLRLSPIRLAGLIIHELAHQKYYLPGDSRFNEAFAVTVERAGVLGWLKSSGRDDLIPQARMMWGKEDLMASEILKARARLIDVYRGDSNPQSMEGQKRAVFEHLEADLHRAGARSPRTGGEEIKLNNAYLVPIDTYYSLVPVFQNILDSLEGSLPRFFEKVVELGKLPAQERLQELESWRRPG